jgi:hypothetical protein
LNVQSHKFHAIFLRLQVLLASAALIIFLAGCGGNAFKSASMAPTGQTTTTPPPPAPSPAPAGGASTQPSVQFTDIQNMSNWQWCSKDLNGAVCASGRGNAVSWQAQHQTQPSLSGSSAEFYIGGSTGYSNALWWRSLGPSSQPTHFTYDLWFYVDKGPVVQALEFDVNQTVSGTRYVFGTECNIKGTHAWDVWDGTRNVWVRSPAPCTPFQSKSWNHLVWNFERTKDGEVHYMNVAVNGNQVNVNMYLAPQLHYGGQDDVNVAFQMDGDYRQDAYHSWLDKVTLRGW